MLQPAYSPQHPHSLSRRTLLAWASIGLMGASECSMAASAPSISATLLDGRAFSLDQMAGKVLLVNFWATWCGPCREEMPEIEAYYRQHHDQGLEVLALSTDELADERKVRDAARPFTFAVAMLKASRISGFGRIWRMPVSAVIDRQGRLVKQDWFIEPKLDAAALDAVIKPLL